MTIFDRVLSVGGGGGGEWSSLSKFGSFSFWFIVDIEFANYCLSNCCFHLLSYLSQTINSTAFILAVQIFLSFPLVLYE